MLATLLSFLFAELSYRLIERPALRLKDRFAVVRGSARAATRDVREATPADDRAAA